jgi:alkylation response protein AidB-like acyl-CoA dehydrogenase
MQLTQEQEMIRDMARNFAKTELAPNADEWERNGNVPKETLRKMGQVGLMGVLAPEEWGGAGADFVSYALALEEIAEGHAATSLYMSLNNSPNGLALMKYGTDAQKETFLRPSIQGEMQAAFALTEPHTGSDASNLKTRAEKVGNKWVLNGTKQFISSGESGDYCMIFAVTDPDAGKKGISAFLTPTDVPGYTVVAKEDKMGQRASDLCQLAFEDLEIPPDMMLGEEGQGYRIALENLTTGRIGIAAQSTGIARAALECATEYAKEREAFGKVIMEHQAVSHRLADMATQVEAAHHLLLHAARLFDADGGGLVEASMAKLFASEMAEKVCSDAVQTLGGYGYVGGFPVDRYYRDVRVCKIYEGTSDVQRMLIARSLAA